MLEKPDLEEEKIISCLRYEYGLYITQIDFLPLGADPNTIAYRAVSHDENPYFVKLRKSNFEETAVTLPKFLGDQGILNIITPFTTNKGRLWADLETFKLILYPFVDGRNGYEVDMSDRHWLEFGSVLKRIHTSEILLSIKNGIRKETYSPQWREKVKAFLKLVESESFIDPVAVDLASFLKVKHGETLDLIERAERLALNLQADSPTFTVCHSDIHAGNIFIDSKDMLYIVDWDNPILAPKERDLMFVGGAQGFSGHTLEEEATLFYRGYGQTQVNQSALAYYRYERIIEDIAVFCEQLLSTDEGGEDREVSLGYLKSNFLPNNTIEAAYRSERNMMDR
jgi:spectinomycin phosphotransferase